MAVKKVGTLIREARTAKKYSQEQLASEINGLSGSDIGKAERGEKDLSQTHLRTIAKVLGITQKSLLEAPKGGSSATAASKKTASAAKTTTASKTSAAKKTTAAKAASASKNTSTTAIRFEEHIDDREEDKLRDDEEDFFRHDEKSDKRFLPQRFGEEADRTLPRGFFGGQEAGNPNPEGR